MASSVPNHVAIIMDGNGRWAQNRGFGRSRGHREGAKRVDEITEACADLGVKYLTVYAFSTENWNRPRAEVQMLMRLLVQYLGSLEKKLIRNGVSLRAQGNLSSLPDFVRAELARVTQASALAQPKLVLTLCLSYGGRQEILDAAKGLAKRVERGELSWEKISEADFAAEMYQPTHPDPDLLIRTGGEFRVSNFLLWEIAYSEIFVTDTLWPDFTRESLEEAIHSFTGRERRFGRTSAQVQQEEETRP